jgi:hypothetical protein
MKLEEILNNLSSNDLEVLRSCDSNAETMLESEKRRGERAEDKAQDVLKMCGAGATIIAASLGFIYGRITMNPSWTVLLPFIAAILFVVKSVWFSLMVFGPAKLYRATPDLIFDIQKRNQEDALRYTTAVKLWLFDINVPENTRKLFHLDRAIRNFAGFIFTLLLGGIVIIALLKGSGAPRDYALYAAEVIALLAVIFVDSVSERLGKLWKYS